MKSIAASIILIVICGGIGGVAAWQFVGWLELTGPIGALVAAAVGMVIAVGAFAGTTTLLRGVGWMK
jgi:predicted PurR-regulated permease PerM